MFDTASGVFTFDNPASKLFDTNVVLTILTTGSTVQYKKEIELKVVSVCGPKSTTVEAPEAI